MREVPSDSAAQAWTHTKVAEQQCECARRFAFFVVAKQAGASVEYLRKVCRKYDCAASEFEPNEEGEDSLQSIERDVSPCTRDLLLRGGIQSLFRFPGNEGLHNEHRRLATFI